MEEIVFSLFSHNFVTVNGFSPSSNNDLPFVLTVILRYHSSKSVEFYKSYRANTHTHKQTDRHDHPISPLIGLITQRSKVIKLR
jgi:hypothetical protein